MAILAVATGCAGDPAPESSGPSFASTPEHSAVGKEQFHFESLEGIAAESPVVLRATVTGVDVGRTYGEAEDQFTTRFVRLQPLEVVRGDVPLDQELVYEEEGWYADGAGYVMNGVAWSAVGDEAWYFLRPSDGGTYRLMSSYGRYDVLAKDHKGGPSGHDPEHEGPWVALVHSAAAPAKVSDAIRSVTGKVGR